MSKNAGISMRGEQKTMNEIKTITVGENVFEIINYVPVGYSIWNIGRNMIDGYLPLCRLSPYQSFPGGREIEADTLKAIKCDGAQTILEAIGGGQCTVEEFEQYIKHYRNSKSGTWSHRQVERMKRALPYMKQIKGL